MAAYLANSPSMVREEFRGSIWLLAPNEGKLVKEVN